MTSASGLTSAPPPPCQRFSVPSHRVGRGRTHRQPIPLIGSCLIKTDHLWTALVMNGLIGEPSLPRPFGSKGDFTPANRDVRSYPRKRTLAHRSSIASGVDFIATIVIVSLNLTADRIRASFFEA